ncbi:MAG: phosphoribosylamine--glycine ligase [Mobilibacterium timonense]|uniref:phosphoribosylamine--glycine ligase n=1 Tax=Mobilibacterium timonense TaxID=1871012 RepID=UPI0023564331|nr:phosphoribosylamine--glycine ligase [Mobilibacterium timonense]MBM6991635.1 phosphoribosylamine--glycine ligase [Mobilibacterium timonense]
MKIAVVGGGGREHAIIKALKNSPKVDKIYALPGNGGIAADAECVDIGAKELSRIVDFAVDNAIDYVVVAPDDPLAMGLVDLLEAKGIPAFGPKASAAIIESSKAWSKDMMRRYGIPTAEYRTFDDPGEAMEYVEKAELPVVIKADGLALGKGVIIAESREDAREGIKSIMEDKKFGDSGNVVVIEEFLRGPEVSVLAFTDGNVVRPMISSMDHKRALDGDKGLNTGGMGTIAPNPYYTQAVADECMEKIFLPTIKAMNQEGRTFRGCLYFGLMITEKGPKVIEYNSRFGDPETQVVLPLLQGDLLDIMMACTNGTLSDVDFRFSSDSACCVVAASGGYPVSYKKGYPVTLPDDTSRIYIAGTKLQNGVQVTSGGRVLGVTETAPTLREAVDKAYRTMEKVSFQDMYYRKDIGARALEALEK